MVSTLRLVTEGYFFVPNYFTNFDLVKPYLK